MSGKKQNVFDKGYTKVIRSASNLSVVTEQQQISYDVEAIQRSWSWRSLKLGRPDCNTSSNACKNSE